MAHHLTELVTGRQPRDPAMRRVARRWRLMVPDDPGSPRDRIAHAMQRRQPRSDEVSHNERAVRMQGQIVGPR
jgi:hypothetical protein